MSLETMQEQIPGCKYCGSHSVSRCGYYQGVRRYLCKTCGRKFKPDSHLFYMSVPVEAVSAALSMHYANHNIHDIRKFLREEYQTEISSDTIYRWITRFTLRAIPYFNYLAPDTGRSWLIGETVRRVSKINTRTYDVVDLRSRFLLTTYHTETRSRRNIQTLFDQAIEKAGKRPDTVMLFLNYSFFDRIKSVFPCSVEHVDIHPPDSLYNTGLIECFKNISIPRNELIDRIKTPAEANIQFEGWQIVYNYFQRQSLLDNRTPAEAAGINYPAKSWLELIKLINAHNR